MRNISSTGQRVKVAMLCLSVLWLQGCSEKIDARQTQVVQGLVYKMNASDPFSGTLINYQPNDLGVPVHGTCEVHLKDGVLNGTAVCLYDNGEKFLEIEYASGKYNGEFKLWHSQTKKMISKTSWKSGAKDGIEEHYNPSTGKIVSKENWSGSGRVGEQKVWDATGETLLVSLVWTDGKKTGYENLNDSERNFKDGHLEGIEKKYALSNGSMKRYLRSEASYINGMLEGKRTEWDEFGNVIFIQMFKNDVVQSQTKQSWKDGKIVGTQSAVNLSDGGADARKAVLKKDGKEFADVEIDGVFYKFDIDWVKGRPIKGNFEQRQGGKIIATYTGIGIATVAGDTLVKDGVEKKWDKDGNLVLEVTWERGIALNMSSRADGKMFKIERPQPGTGDLQPQITSTATATSYR